MGRSQIHSAQRQVVQQQCDKSLAQGKQQQSQATSRLSSPPHQQLPLPRRQNSPKDAQVYRPTPVREHPDDAFLTGAWMFDSTRVPQWMLSQLPKQQASHQFQLPTATSAMPKPINSKSSRQNMNAQVYHPTPIKSAHPDDAFFSGAWLFDQASVPQWLASQLHAPPSKRRPTNMRTQNDPQLALLDGWAIDSLKPLPNAVELLEAKEEQRLAMEIENQNQRTQLQSSVRQRREAQMSGKRQSKPGKRI